MKKLGFKFVAFSIFAAIIYTITTYLVVMSFIGPDSVKLITKILPFNAMMDTFMWVSMAYLGVNLVDKWTTDYSKLALPEDGVSRKAVLYFTWVFYFLLTSFAFIRLNSISAEYVFDLSKLVTNFSLITVLFMGSRAAEKPLMLLDPPVKPKDPIAPAPAPVAPVDPVVDKPAQ